MPNPNLLTPSRLNNALPNILTPLHLINAFPTRRSFNLSPSSRQVDSRHPHPFPTRRSFNLYSSSRQVNSRQPHSFPTRRLSTFTPLRQVYSRRFIGLTTAVGRSPIAYLPHSMRLSPSFLAPYIYVSSTFLCHITRYPPLIFYVSSSVPRLRLPLFHLSLFLTSVDPL